MKTKIFTTVLICAFLNGCAATANKAANDFLDGASSSAESRRQKQSNFPHQGRSDPDNEFIEDTMSGVLTAIFRGMFGSDDDND
ncbi:hypothetical protein [Alteromonas sp. S167]|uniref:hypothetical protein n=1 Tax=Alteromonas sp. S167 TaxID=3117402 RepID=UPI002FE3AB58